MSEQVVAADNTCASLSLAACNRLEWVGARGGIIR